MCCVMQLAHEQHPLLEALVYYLAVYVRSMGQLRAEAVGTTCYFITCDVTLLS